MLGLIGRSQGRLKRLRLVHRGLLRVLLPSPVVRERAKATRVEERAETLHFVGSTHGLEVADRYCVHNAGAIRLTRVRQAGQRV